MCKLKKGLSQQLVPIPGHLPNSGETMNRKKLIFFWLFVWSFCWLPAAHADYFYRLEAKDFMGGILTSMVEEGTSLTFPIDYAVQKCTYAGLNNSPSQYIGTSTKYEEAGDPYSSSATAHLWYTPTQACTAHVTFAYTVEAQGLGLYQAEMVVTGDGFIWKETSSGPGSFDQYINIDPGHPLDFALWVAGKAETFSDWQTNYYEGSATITNLSIEFSPSQVPLPSTFWLVLSGLAGAAWFKGRRISS